MSDEIAKYNAPIATVPQTALASAELERANADVQYAILTAKKWPRDQVVATERIMTACQREGLAKEALYSYARGGTEISGPSIRLAEAIAQAWGNIDFGVEELEQRPGESTAVAFALDLETNVKKRLKFQVKHERHTKKGNYRLEDSRDIYEVVANFGARRLRNCILAIIPGDVVESAVSQCEATLKAKADTSPEALKKLVDAFVTFGINKEQIEKRLQRRLDTITPAQLISLRKVYNSMKDGMSSAADWFEIIAPEVKDASADLTAKLKAKKAKEDVPPMEEMAPAECPEREHTTMSKKYCDETCVKRVGCPIWA
jgi:hypothetical protein